MLGRRLFSAMLIVGASMAVWAGAAQATGSTPSSTVLVLHNPAHQAIGAVERGVKVHEAVTVSGGAGTPTGTVTITEYGTDNCSIVNGSITYLPVTLDANGKYDNAAYYDQYFGAREVSYEAVYSGDGTYAPSTSPCAPLYVVDASVQLTPSPSALRIGQTETLTGHVTVDGGPGPIDAPAGTMIDFAFNSQPPTRSCITSDDSGTCSVTYSSSVTGTDMVQASTTVLVDAVSLTRATGNMPVHWVNAKIAISPSSTGAVNQTQTFTVTLSKDTGDGNGFVAAAGEHVDFTLTNGGGANASGVSGTCTNAGVNTDANGQCTITFTSSTLGTVTGNATSTLSVAGSAPFTVSTDGVAPNSGGAVERFIAAAPTLAVTAPAAGAVGTAIAPSGVSGVLASGLSPTGTITFTVFGPQATAPTSCDSGGTTVGTATVSGNGTYHPSAGLTPSSPGNYWWYASYGGDSQNTVAASTCGAGMAETVVVPKPVITAAAASPPNGTNGWYTTNVTVTFTCTDDGGPGIAPGACPADQILSSEGTSVSSTAKTVTDLNGNVSDPSNIVTVKIDKTPPTLAPTVSPSTVLQGGAIVASPHAGDALSGLASAGCAAPDTSTPGVKTLTCTATDNAGNTATAQVPYTVQTTTFLYQSASPGVSRGGQVWDTATLSNGANPTGTLTFKLYGPNPWSCWNVPAVATFNVPVHGNGSYRSPSFTPLYAGNYYWLVTYSGDGVSLASSTPCGGTGGSVFVHA